MKTFEVVNSAIRAISTLCHCKNLATWRLLGSKFK